MTAQQLAQVVLAVLPKVSLPMTPENLNVGASLYDTLGKMSRGELILTEPLKDHDHAE